MSLRALQTRGAVAVAATLLASCASGQGGPLARGKATAPGSAVAARPAASASPTSLAAQGDRPASEPFAGPSTAPPSPKPSAAAPKPLHLTMRLGLALPPSLVGLEGQARLNGQDGLVAPPGTEFVVGPDGSLLSNNGSNLIGNHSSGLIGNHSSGLVGNHGGSLVSDQGGAYRLAQAEAPTRDQVASATPRNPFVDPRTQLWLILGSFDYCDQLMAHFLRAKPRLGAWKRFGTEAFRSFPPPMEVPGVRNPQLESDLQAIVYAGLLTEEAGGARLRFLALPAPEAPLSEGRPVFDLRASGTEQVARTRFVPRMEAYLGFKDTSSEMVVSEGPHGRRIVSRIAERGDPQRHPFSIAGLLQPNRVENSRRYLRFEHHAPQQASVLIATAEHQRYLDGKPDTTDRKLLAIGYDPSASGTPGLALLERRAFLNVDPSGQLLWDPPFFPPQPGAMPLWPYFMVPGGALVQPGPPELLRLVPPFRVEEDALVPPLPSPEEDPTQDPSLRIEAIPPELFQRPEAP
jgi:hypothetical protein